MYEIYWKRRWIRVSDQGCSWCCADGHSGLQLHCPRPFKWPSSQRTGAGENMRNLYEMLGTWILTIWQLDFLFFWAENMVGMIPMMKRKHPETSKFQSLNLPFSSWHPDHQHIDFQVRLGMGIALLGALNARRLACNLSWSPVNPPPIC